MADQAELLSVSDRARDCSTLIPAVEPLMARPAVVCSHSLKTGVDVRNLAGELRGRKTDIDVFSKRGRSACQRCKRQA
jgi:hypothetical protein